MAYAYRVVNLAPHWQHGTPGSAGSTSVTAPLRSATRVKGLQLACTRSQSIRRLLLLLHHSASTEISTKLSKQQVTRVGGGMITNP
jgi:hypothetical protein